MHPYSRYAGLPPEGEARYTWLPLWGSCRRLRGCICREAAIQLKAQGKRLKALYVRMQAYPTDCHIDRFAFFLV